VVGVRFDAVEDMADYLSVTALSGMVTLTFWPCDL